MSSHPLLGKMLRFIEDYQRRHSHKSSAEIAQELRAYTRPRYANQFWELVAGDNPDFVRGELDNEEVIIAGQEIDFAHFIAVLSDQFPGGNFASAVVDGFFFVQSFLLDGLPYDSREFTSAIGDTAQAIETYLSRYGSSIYYSERLASILQRQASDMDYASDLTAFMAGNIIKKSPPIYVSEAIAQVDLIPYTEIVATYIQTILGGKIDTHTQSLSNLKQVKSRIRKRISVYLCYKQDFFHKRILKPQYRQRTKNALVTGATEHFLAYLLRQGNLVTLEQS